MRSVAGTSSCRPDASGTYWCARPELTLVDAAGLIVVGGERAEKIANHAGCQARQRIHADLWRAQGSADAESGCQRRVGARAGQDLADDGYATQNPVDRVGGRDRTGNVQPVGTEINRPVGARP